RRHSQRLPNRYDPDARKAHRTRLRGELAAHRASFQDPTVGTAASVPPPTTEVFRAHARHAGVIWMEVSPSASPAGVGVKALHQWISAERSELLCFPSPRRPTSGN